jgi:hypothetical protein
MNTKYTIKIDQSIKRIQTIKFNCNNPEFAQNLKDILNEFYTKYEGEIIFED